jgi:hypothetical protein
MEIPSGEYEGPAEGCILDQHEDRQPQGSSPTTPSSTRKAARYLAASCQSQPCHFPMMRYTNQLVMALQGHEERATGPAGAAHNY